MIWHRFPRSHHRIAPLLIPIVAASVLLAGCSKVTEMATGECAGGSTVVLIDNSPTADADPDFRADQSATAIDNALAACDELHLASFSSTVQEVDLKGTPTRVEGKNPAIRDENRPVATAAIVTRLGEHLEATSADPAGSDIVAAIEFAHRTYLRESEDGAQLIIMSDGLATRPDLSDPQVIADPEGAVGALGRAGLDDVDLSGVEVVLVGVGHSDAEDPLPRELVDTLFDVWEQALARSGAQVEAVEALPGSAGKAAAVSSDASERGRDSEEGAVAPSWGAPKHEAYLRSGVQATSRRRLRRPVRGDGGRAPFAPSSPDRTTAAALQVAADPSTGSSATVDDETRAIDAMADLQRWTITARLALRGRRLIAKAAALRPSATVEWVEAAQTVRHAAREEQELRGTQLAAAGRTHRSLSRRAAVAIEIGLVCFDAWALGNAAAIAANLAVLDGVLVALGGTAGMVIGAKVVGVAIAHHLEDLRFGNEESDEVDPAVMYFATELHRGLSRPHALAAAGLGVLLIIAAVAVGLVRAESGGLDVAALMFGLTVFTTVATAFVEVLSANVLADQVDERTKQMRRAHDTARRATNKRRARDLRAFNRSTAHLAARGEQAVARSAAHGSVARAGMFARFGAHDRPQPASTSPDASIESMRSGGITAATPEFTPFVGVDLGVGRNQAYLHPLASQLDRELLVEHAQEAQQHWAVVAARLRRAGIEIPTVEDRTRRADEAPPDEVADTLEESADAAGTPDTVPADADAGSSDDEVVADVRTEAVSANGSSAGTAQP